MAPWRKRLHRLRPERPERGPGEGTGEAPAPGKPAAASWKRTLAIVWVSQFVALIGFSMVIPFLPLYVTEMGVTGDAEVKLWSGLLLSGNAVTMGLFAPIWGSLADRFGRKLMLERAAFGAAVVMTLMSFAQTPGQLLLLRIIQGSVTGTVPAATTLIASVVPRERIGFALGLLQMGMFSGVSVGPLVGGVIADTLGYRYAFLLTGACLFLAALGVLLLVREDFQRPQVQAGERRPPWWEGLVTVLRSHEPLVVLIIRLLTRTGARVLGPVLPLFVVALLPDSTRVATMTGVVAGTSSAATALGAALLGRWSDRVGYRPVLLISIVVTAGLYAVQSLVVNTTQLLILQFCVGLSLAGSVSTLAALLAQLSPDGKHGAVFGLDSSVVSAANALGPMMGAAIAVALGNRAAFLLAGAFFVVSAVLAAWQVPRSSGRPGAAGAPAPDRPG